MKRLISIILSAALLSSVFFGVCETAFADAVSVTAGETVYYDSGNEKTKLRTSHMRKSELDTDSYRFVEDTDELCIYLRDCFVKREESVKVFLPWEEKLDVKEEVTNLSKKARFMQYSANGEDGDYLHANSLISAHWYKYTLTLDGGKYVFLEYVITYRTTTEEEAAVTRAINEVKPSLIKDTDYETLKAIHDYICENTTYDHYAAENNTPQKSTAYSLLINHRCVCSGYASTFYRIARELGLNVRYTRSAKLNHAWNSVELNGKWYYIDCTFDDIDDAVDGDNSTVTNQNTVYNYFLKGSGDFTNHEADDITQGYEAPVNTDEFSQTGFVFDDDCEHSFDSSYYRNSKCSGLYARVDVCSKCNATRSVLLGTSEEHSDKGCREFAPTCKRSGYSKGGYCTNCNATLKERNKLGVKSHTKKEKIIKATGTDTGMRTVVCAECEEEFEKSTIPRISSVEISKSTFVYSGKNIRPSVSAKDVLGKAIASKYYTVNYPKTSAKPGTYTVTVTFKDYYSYSAVLKFTVLPKGTSISKIIPSKRALKIKWKKQKTQTDGYQIQCSTNNKFTANVKTRVVEGAGKSSYKMTGLKNRKKYYVRVRTFKDSGKKRYYSSWSKVSVKSTK